MLNSPLAKMSTAADFYASVKHIFDSFEAKDPGIKAKVCGVLGLPNTKISDAFTNTIDGCIQQVFNVSAAKMMERCTVSNEFLNVYFEISVDMVASAGVSAQFGSLKRVTYNKVVYDFIAYQGGASFLGVELKGSIGVAGPNGFDGKKHALRVTGSVGSGALVVSATLIFACTVENVRFDQSYKDVEACV